MSPGPRCRLLAGIAGLSARVRLGEVARGALAGQDLAPPVHLRDQVAIGGTGGFEFVAALGQHAAEFGVVLLQAGDLLLESADVRGCAEPGLLPCLLPEEFGQPLLELPVVLGEAGDTLVGGGEVGDERGAADGWPSGG